MPRRTRLYNQKIIFFHNYTNYGNRYANRLEDMYGIGIQYSIVESKNTSNDEQHGKHGDGYER
jgi:hypothetical protein